MKIYTSKLKALGYEHVPEESDSISETYVNHENKLERTIVFFHQGEDTEKRITFTERKMNDDGSWRYTGMLDINPEELDAINDFCTENKFGEDVTWLGEIGKYFKRRGR